MSNIMETHAQWRERPFDERYASLEELSETCHAVKGRSHEATMETKDISIVNDDGDLVFFSGGIRAELGNYYFDTLCQSIGAPAGFLRKLPVDQIAQDVNYMLQQQESKPVKVLAYQKEDGNLVVRGQTGPNYERMWDAMFADQCVEFQTRGWKVPPAMPVDSNQPGTRPATSADCLDDTGFWGSVRPGDLIAPAGIYRSDHDLYVFMVNCQPISDELSRFFILSGSEVYGMAARLVMGYMRHVCRNHIIWGAEGVREIRVIHTEGARARWDQGQVEEQIHDWSNQGVNGDLEMIDLSKAKRIGQDKAEVCERVYDKRLLSLKQAGQAFDCINEEQDGDPLSVWGYVNGVTRMSQQYAYAERRNEMDKTASRVLKTFMN